MSVLLSYRVLVSISCLFNSEISSVFPIKRVSYL
nr:MAG TPA: hypothetical protein [Caudoviricetes sp.]